MCFLSAWISTLIRTLSVLSDHFCRVWIVSTWKKLWSSTSFNKSQNIFMVYFFKDPISICILLSKTLNTQWNTTMLQWLQRFIYKRYIYVSPYMPPIPFKGIQIHLNFVLWLHIFNTDCNLKDRLKLLKTN